MAWNIELLSEDYNALLLKKKVALEAIRAEAETLAFSKGWPTEKQKAFVDYAVNIEEGTFAEELKFFERYKVEGGGTENVQSN